MSISPIFRPATQADAKAVAQVYLTSRKKFVSFAPVAHSDEAVLQWVHDILIPTNQVTVVVKDGKIIGMMALSTDGETGWIDQLYLHPDVVGCGIGTQLIEQAKAELGSPIQLYTFKRIKSPVDSTSGMDSRQFSMVMVLEMKKSVLMFSMNGMGDGLMVVDGSRTIWQSDD